MVIAYKIKIKVKRRIYLLNIFIFGPSPPPPPWYSGGLSNVLFVYESIQVCSVVGERGWVKMGGRKWVGSQREGL